MVQRINTIVRSKYSPKDTRILWIDTTDNSLKQFRLNKWTKVVEDALIKITYSELKDLRDNGKLIPGTQYQITDYTCTTTQENTRSVGHIFDIIVTADDKSTLNEIARAVKHEGDNYFNGCNLNAWKVWYCLDNDTTRFAWADTINGKGVIYRMIDDWNNDVPYDFKNIQFNGNWGYYAYTFNWINDGSDNSCEDLSVAQYNHYNDNYGYSHTNNNIIKLCVKKNYDECNINIQCLNVCLILNAESDYDGFFEGCSYNTFGNNCHNNTFKSSCIGTTFGNNCINNNMNSNCSYNSFGNNCSNNNYQGYCVDNTFGNNCSNNTFEYSCYNNTFGNNCSNNTFEYNCYNNVLGNDCRHIVLGGDCHNNSFGNNCCYIVLGSGCYNNFFGIDCQFIKFTLADNSVQTYNYYRNNKFGDGCQYIIFKGEETASYYNQVQNYNFSQGLRMNGVYLNIEGLRNKPFETKVAKNSNEELKIYCEADLVQ